MIFTFDDDERLRRPCQQRLDHAADMISTDSHVLSRLPLSLVGSPSNCVFTWVSVSAVTSAQPRDDDDRPSSSFSMGQPVLRQRCLSPYVCG